MVRKAAIDIGTNSTRLLITDVDERGHFFPIVTQERLTHLGAGLDAAGRLAPEAMERVLAAVREYKSLCQKHHVVEIRLFATSATRDAVNRAEFLHRIRETTGLSCRLLTGEEEATLSFLGATSDIDVADRVMVWDLGGGSTEIVLGRQGRILERTSLDVGSRRMTTRFLHGGSIDHGIEALRRAVRSTLESQLKDFSRGVFCIGVGGTITTLAMMDRKIDLHDADKVHGVRLTKAAVKALVQRLAQADEERRRRMIGLHPQRAPVMLAGSLIVETLMSYFAVEEIQISLRDALYGILLERNQ